MIKITQGLARPDFPKGHWDGGGQSVDGCGGNRLLPKTLSPPAIISLMHCPLPESLLS